MDNYSQPMQLIPVQTVKRSAVNDTLICEDWRNTTRSRYTVLKIHDHEVLHRFIEIYDNADYLQDEPNVRMYADKGEFFAVYPYVPERPLMDFYMGEAMSLRECEEICVNLIIACMTCNLPWPVLYLLLKQREIHLAKDSAVYFSYRFDLTELSDEIGESECVVECARLLLELLRQNPVRRANSYILLQKRTEKQSYDYFKDLYKDLEMAMEPVYRGGILTRIRLWYLRNKDVLFRVLLRVSIVLAVFVILTFLTNLIFGDVPWLRLFIRSFEKIGRESLLQ